MTVAMPTVTATANSATEFDVTFTGSTGMEQQPLLVGYCTTPTTICCLTPR